MHACMHACMHTDAISGREIAQGESAVAEIEANGGVKREKNSPGITR
jgi:hypothetical protein